MSGVRRAPGVVVAACALLLSACGGGTRCTARGVEPPARVRPSSPLLVGLDDHHRSSPQCPPVLPRPGSPCTLIGVHARDSLGGAAEVWPTCYYERPGAACDPDGCSCQRPSPDAPPTFVCERLVIE